MQGLLQRVPRVYVNSPLTQGGVHVIEGPAGHHLARVLRARAGDAVVLFDGSGGEHHGRIASIARERIEAQLLEYHATEREAPVSVTLVQGVSSADRMDYTVQKATELGVRAIQPLITQLSVVKLDERRARSRVEHWQRVVISACEQCGRNRVPQVLVPLAFDRYCRDIVRTPRMYVLTPDAALSLSAATNQGTGAVTIAIGPEAGFSDTEQELLESRGFTPVRLGARLLRTESAAPAALAVLNTVGGEF